MIETMSENAAPGPQHEPEDMKSGSHHHSEGREEANENWKGEEPATNENSSHPMYPGTPDRMIQYPTGMIGLEGQFQNLEIQGSDSNSYLPPSTGESSTSNDVEGDNEEEPVKLFVGQVREFRNFIGHSMHRREILHCIYQVEGQVTPFWKRSRVTPLQTFLFAWHSLLRQHGDSMSHLRMLQSPLLVVHALLLTHYCHRYPGL